MELPHAAGIRRHGAGLGEWPTSSAAHAAVPTRPPPTLRAVVRQRVARRYTSAGDVSGDRPAMPALAVRPGTPAPTTTWMRRMAAVSASCAEPLSRTANSVGPE